MTELFFKHTDETSGNTEPIGAPVHYVAKRQRRFCCVSNLIQARGLHNYLLFNFIYKGRNFSTAYRPRK